MDDEAAAGQDSASSAELDRRTEESVQNEELERDLRALDPSAKLLHFAQGDDVTRTALAVVQTDGDPAGLTERLAAELGRRPLRVLPLVFGAHELRALEERVPGRRWIEALSPGAGRRQQLARLHDNRQRRRWLLGTIRSHRAVLDFARRSDQLPLWLTVQLCAIVVKDALELLFATRDATCDPLDGEAAATFKRLFVDPGSFTHGDYAVGLELEALAVQARLLAGIAPDVRLDWLDAVERARHMLDRFARHVRQAYLGATERRRRQRLVQLGATVAAATLLGSIIATIVSTRPEAAMSEAAEQIAGRGGIVGVYYNGRQFEERILARTDRGIAMSTSGSPAPGVAHDNFSIRWTGFIHFPQGGKHVLCVECDDGARLYFNGRKLIDDWRIQSTNRTCATVRVEQGWYPLRAEYFEVSKSAVMRLMWGADRTRVQVVPAEHLCCRGPDDKGPRTGD